MKYEITKGSEKDFEGGLSGCTHVYDAGAARIWCSGEHSVLGSFRLIAERRPITEQAWNGEGLPPVGVECEGLFPRHHGNSFEWQDCLVLYAFEHECAVKSKVTSTLHYCDQFRPARSPEDVARDEAIDDLLETMIYFYGNPKGAESYRGLAVRIIEAIEIGKISRIKME